MKHVALFITLFLTGYAVAAICPADSTKTRKEVHPTFSFGMGALIGCTDCKTSGKSANFSANAGWSYPLSRKFAAGVGIGFDNYEFWKTMPLYGSVSWDLFGKQRHVFVQLNGGYASAWLNKSAKEYGFHADHGGKVINPEVGYRIPFGAASLSFTLGYKFQRVFSDYQYPNYIYPLMVNNPTTIQNRIDMNRVVLSMRVSWK